MSENKTIINGGNATIQHSVYAAKNDRSDAVGIALEIIKQASVGATPGQIESMLDKLDSWADKIYEAAKK